MSALVNGDTVTTADGITDASGAISLEQYAAQRAGYTVTVVPGATWTAMSAADFAKYQLLVIGDPQCGVLPASATSNASTWAPVVMGTSGLNPTVGNRTLAGIDPEYHYAFGGGGAQPTVPGDPSSAGAEHLVQAGITFAGGVAGATGVYFDTSCADNGSIVSVLNSLSSAGTGFTENASPPCGGSVQFVATNPVFSIVSDTDIQGWGCSDHLTYPTFPVDWQPVAVATDTPSHPTCGTDPHTGTAACGEAYVLVAGKGIVAAAPDLALTPATGTDPAGGSHTVTATVTQSGSPLSGQLVTFVITGQNAGVAGSCVPASCVSGADGKVMFTYADSHGAGTDTINASVTISGTTEHATAAETWTGTGHASPTIATTPSGSVPAGGNVSDSATLSGGSAPSGTITFSLYGPGDATCKTVIATRVASVSGNGTYGSGNVVAATAGTYNWVAAYSGDPSNDTATSGCGAETVTVTKAVTALITTPSGSVPAGGNVSDSATLSGGSTPTGTITFSLYGPGDTTCKTVIATRAASVSGNGTYGSGNVVASTAGTYNWVAAYSGDTGNNSSASGCGDEKVVVTLQTLTGRAFGLSVKTALLSPAPTPDTGSISTTAAGSTSTPCIANIGGIVSAHTVCVNVTTAQNPASSTSKATVADASVGLPLLPVIATTAVASTSTSTCAGSSGATTIASLKVGSTVVIPTSSQPAPNTTVNVGLVKLILNEQVPVPGGLTVNAVHIIVPNIADVIISSATSDIHNCP